MSKNALDDFIDDCFIGNDPICGLYREDSLWLDRYASKLVAEKASQSEESQTCI